jgi:predicted  nucleic acid-binding Zn-ribbon protein
MTRRKHENFQENVEDVEESVRSHQKAVEKFNQRTEDDEERNFVLRKQHSK